MQTGDCLPTHHPCSDAGYADLPLTLLGSPVSTGETRFTVSSSARQDRDLSRHPPGTGPHVPVRHYRGSDAIHSSRSPGRIGLKPTWLHLVAHKYMEKETQEGVTTTPKAGKPNPTPGPIYCVCVCVCVCVHVHIYSCTVIQAHSRACPRNLVSLSFPCCVIARRESVCCLLVLNSVSSTPQWTHQPGPRDVDFFVRGRCQRHRPRVAGGVVLGGSRVGPAVRLYAGGARGHTLSSKNLCTSVGGGGS